MAKNQGETSLPSQEFTVRVPRNSNKSFSIMRFNISNKVDFTKLQQAQIQRENNFKAYKTAHDIEDLPKFGAGSEYGREAKEEARRKKYGMVRKHYNPKDQPWLMKLNSTGKQTRKFKGSKEGGIADNAAYYIFIQSADGAFEAFPVDEWYNFTPVINYKYLNSDEAEEEYSRRDKTYNYFSIMLKKRLKNEEEGPAEEEEGTSTKSKSKKGKALMLTEMEDWYDMSDDNEDEDEDEEKTKDDDEGPKKGKKKDAVKKKKKKKDDEDSDKEAMEESDDGDFDDRELDYITDTSSSDNEEAASERDKSRYDEKGVVDEEGLRDINESEESEADEEKKEEEEEEETNEKNKNKGNDSSSSSSDSDSDPDEENISSVLFMQKKKKPSSRRGSVSSESNASRPNTPVIVQEKDDGKGKGAKRSTKPEVESPLAKRVRTNSPATITPSSSSASLASLSGDGITEEAVRRYLQRKPMTARDLLQKFKKTGLKNEQLQQALTQILKRINPEKKTIQDQLHFFLTKSD